MKDAIRVIGATICAISLIGIILNMEILIADIAFICGIVLLAYSLPSKRVEIKTDLKPEDDTGINFEQIEKNVDHMNKILWGERK